VRRVVSNLAVRLVPVLLLVTLGTSLLVELLPGDPAVAILGPNATPDDYDNVRQELGLDQSAGSRYLSWLGGVVHGDFGRTLVPPVQDVADVIMSRLPVTLELTVLATLMALVLSVPIGLWSAYRLGGAFDRFTSTSAYAVISLPSFLLGLTLIFVAVLHPSALRGVTGALVAAGFIAVVGWVLNAKRNRAAPVRPVALAIALALCVLGALAVAFWPELPRQGYVRISTGGLLENLRSLFLPALTLALIETAQLSQILRNDAAVTLREDFVLAARAKGMPPVHILTKEVLRPSSFSLVTVAGISFGRLLGGTVIVETLFRLPGMGTLIVQSVATKDFAVLQASILLLAVIYVVVNALVDVSYAYLDPRVRRGAA